MRSILRVGATGRRATHGTSVTRRRRSRPRTASNPIRAIPATATPTTYGDLRSMSNGSQFHRARERRSPTEAPFELNRPSSSTPACNSSTRKYCSLSAATPPRVSVTSSSSPDNRSRARGSFSVKPLGIWPTTTWKRSPIPRPFDHPQGFASVLLQMHQCDPLHFLVITQRNDCLR